MSLQRCNIKEITFVLFRCADIRKYHVSSLPQWENIAPTFQCFEYMTGLHIVAYCVYAIIATRWSEISYYTENTIFLFLNESFWFITSIFPTDFFILHICIISTFNRSLRFLFSPFFLFLLCYKNINFSLINANI